MSAARSETKGPMVIPMEVDPKNTGEMEARALRMAEYAKRVLLDQTLPLRTRLETVITLGNQWTDLALRIDKNNQVWHAWLAQSLTFQSSRQRLDYMYAQSVIELAKLPEENPVA